MGLSPYKNIKDSISEVLLEFADSLNLKFDKGYIDSTIDLSKNFGDLSSNLLIRLSKTNGINIEEVSEKLIAMFKDSKYVESIKIDNGFINIFLNKAEVSKLVLNSIFGLKEDYLKSDLGKGKKVIVESPSVNPVHPWHVGQVRSALLGDTISNIFENNGYNVEREDYIDDLGLQSAEALWGLLNKDKLPTEDIDPNEKYDHYIGKIYVAVNSYMKDNDITDDLKELSQNMEVDGSYESMMLRNSVESYINAEYQTAFKLNIFHDVLIWESDIVKDKLLQKAIDILLKKGIVEKSDDEKYRGCIVINYEKIKDLPPQMKGLREQIKVLIRSNGTPDYLAKDIAFHMWKFGIIKNDLKFKVFMDKEPDGKVLYTTSPNGEMMDFGNGIISINTIDARQSYEQSLVKLSLQLTSDNNLSDGFKHIAYGVVNLDNIKLAGRKGTWIGYTADDLIAESENRALSLINNRFNLTDEEKKYVSENIALSAIRYEFLKLSNEKELVFSWDKALNFEGDSGPYCEYMHARAVHIIENAGKQVNKQNIDFSLLNGKYEFELIKLLSIGVDLLEKSSIELKTNILTSYLSNLSTLFGKFYETSPVSKAESEKLKDTRLMLVISFEYVSSKLMKILGIIPLKKM